MKELYVDFNCLIADFMGIKVGENGNYEYPMNTSFLKNHLVREYGVMWGDVDHFDQSKFGYEFSMDSLEYHISWDWIMSVVEKISMMGGYSILFDPFKTDMLLSTYSSVIKFILNHNKSEKSK